MAASHLTKVQEIVLDACYVSKLYMVKKTDNLETTIVRFVRGTKDQSIIRDLNKERGWNITLAQARFYRQTHFGMLYLRGPNKNKPGEEIETIEDVQADPTLPLPEPVPPPEAFAGEPPPPPQDWAALNALQEVVQALREELRVVKERQDVQVVEIFDVTEYLTRQNANWRRKE